MCFKSGAAFGGGMRLATQAADQIMIVGDDSSVVRRTIQAFATFVPIDFTTGHAIDRLWGSSPCFVYRRWGDEKFQCAYRSAND
jgi:hypothetical protein